MNYDAEKVKEELANMSSQQIEHFIRSNNDTLLEQTRFFAIEELKKKTSEEYVENFLYKLKDSTDKKRFRRTGIIISILIILFGVIGVFSIQVGPHEPSVSLFVHAGAFVSAMPYFVMIFAGFVLMLVILILSLI